MIFVGQSSGGLSGKTYSSSTGSAGAVSTSVVVFVLSGSSATGASPHALRMAMLRISKNRDKTFIRFPWGGVCKSTSDKLI